MSDVRLWTFANYKIRDILDVDLVSTTYRATTVDGDELRRVRVFTGDVTEGELAVISDEMIAEVRAAREVTHPNILTIHDAGRHGDRVYVVSDDIHGAVLREFVTRHQPLQPRMALAMGWQLAEALDAVHASGVVHGSINPHTIWVSDVAGRDAPVTYLTGFGSALLLARQVRNQQKAPASDDLLYVGPDQMRHEQASPEADRYALACAVYHLMTGVPPFRRESVNALFGAHLFSSVEPPTAIRDDLPPALDSVFVRALAKETADRYPSAHALMIGVERALRGQPETRGVSSTPESGGASPASEGDAGSPGGTWTVGAVSPSAAPSWTGAAGTEGVTNGEQPPAPPSSEVPDADVAADTQDAPPSVKRDGHDARPTDGPPRPDVPAEGEGHLVVPAAAPDRLQARVDGHAGVSDRSGASDEDAPDEDAPGGDAPGGDAPGDPAEGDVAPVPVDEDQDAGASVETLSGDGVASPAPAGDVDEKDEREPGGTEAPSGFAWPPPRSHGHPAEFFEWGGDESSTVEQRRAERFRRNGDRATRQTPHRAAPPVDPEVATPDKRRSLIGSRNGRLLLFGGVFVVAAVAAIMVATMRGDTPETAREAPVRQANEPVLREPMQPTVVQPLWTTGVADRAVRDIVATDDVVMVNAGRTIGALDPSSGDTLWTRESAARVTDLVVVRDVAVAATADGMSGYDVATGDLRWESDDGAVVPEALAIGRREIFAAARDASGIAISTIDPRNGAVEPLGAIGSDPDPTAGRITLDFDRSARRKGGQTLYLLTPRGLHAFDPSAGAELWRAPVDIDGGLDGPALRDRPWVPSLEAVAGAAFVVGREGDVCRYAAENGEEVWTTCQQFPADLETGPSLYARDARVVVASPDAIAAFDYTNGLPQWSRTQADELRPSVAGSPGLTYVAREDGVLRAFDHGSGLERWRAQDIGDVTALLADEDGVYVGAESGGVVRLAQQALGGSDNR